MASLASDAKLPAASDSSDHSIRPDLSANIILSEQLRRLSQTTEALDELSTGRNTQVTINDKDELFNKKKREVYRFQADWLVSSVAWSNGPGDSFNLALSSYIEEYKNQVQLVTLVKDDCEKEIESVTTFEHSYPATKILWIPRASDSIVRLPNLLATTADYLRLWRVVRDNGGEATANNSLAKPTEKTEVKLECLLNANQGTKNCSPLTSFDWNDIDPSMIVTASVDTTCAIWDIEVSKLVDQSSVTGVTSNSSIYCNLRSQIVAHDHEVYDVSFSRSGSGRDVFVSSGGDGSVRLFDLRKLSTSKVLYEVNGRNNRMRPSDIKALVRVSCNKQDPNYISAFAIDSNDLVLLDLRSPGTPVATLSSHAAQLNSMSWAPHSAHHICTASNDNQALIWELSKLPSPIDEPLLAYRANGKINVINWGSASHSDWIAIGFENYLELLRV